jgi:hypothetical protein
MKIECAKRNKQIDGQATNHNFAPLFEQEWMRAMDLEEMESSSNITLKDVLWWMSIKYACNIFSMV